jgi:hypothetical protein
LPIKIFIRVWKQLGKRNSTIQMLNASVWTTMNKLFLEILNPYLLPPSQKNLENKIQLGFSSFLGISKKLNCWARTGVECGFHELTSG